MGRTVITACWQFNFGMLTIYCWQFMRVVVYLSALPFLIVLAMVAYSLWVMSADSLWVLILQVWHGSVYWALQLRLFLFDCNSNSIDLSDLSAEELRI